MAKHLDVRDVRALGRKAMEHGATVVRPGVIQWDVQGRCTSPVFVERTARKTHHRNPVEQMWYTGPHGQWGRTSVDIQTRCRKCPACLRSRAAYWRQRATMELSRSSRTWFGTLTLSPESHYEMLCRAQSRVTHSGGGFHEMSESEQFMARHVEISKEITLWLKRVRKNSGAKLRYLLVAEAHKSGLPHYHVLVHEWSDLNPVRHRTLTDAWTLGFTKFNLVKHDESQSKTAWYVCKYLTKSAMARVRASVGYGNIRSLNIAVDEQTGPFQYAELYSVHQNPPEKRKYNFLGIWQIYLDPPVGDARRGQDFRKEM